MNSNDLVGRAALAIPEQRVDLELSQRELSRLSGVSATTIRKLERGDRIDPALVVRLAGTLNVLELAASPKNTPPAPVSEFERALAAWTVDPGGVVRPNGGAA